MTMTTSHQSHRRLDVASLVLLLVGVLSWVLSLWLVVDHDWTVLVMIPSVVAATTGALHITKHEAPRP